MTKSGHINRDHIDDLLPEEVFVAPLNAIRAARLQPKPRLSDYGLMTIGEMPDDSSGYVSYRALRINQQSSWWLKPGYEVLPEPHDDTWLHATKSPSGYYVRLPHGFVVPATALSDELWSGENPVIGVLH